MASIFTPEEIDRYLELIQLPQSYRSYQNVPKNYDFLEALHVHQISTIPYENLSLHYSHSHTIDINPRSAYEKFVSGRGRGGYCMEVAVFYKHLLQALGFQTYYTGVRIRLRVDGVPQGGFIGLVHIVNIVTLENGDKYAVDVAFGGDGPTKPMRLEENQPITNLGSQQIRFAREVIPQFETEHKFWIYQYRNSADSDWHSFYCFLEVPFLFEDFGIMSHWTSSVSHQVWTVLLVKFLRENKRIAGKVMLVNDKVKKNMGGKTAVVQVCKSEEERIAALLEHFGITLTDDEKEGIRGTVTELFSETVIPA